MRTIKALLVGLLTAAGMTVGIGTAAAADSHAFTTAISASEPCPCGSPAVDSGLCADCIEVPNPVHEECGYRHMQPYPGGTCPN